LNKSRIYQTAEAFRTATATSREQQFAEKIHAYTLPRMQNTNSRVRDLVDMALLVGSNQLIQGKTKEAILGTFRHPVPLFLQGPPASWEKPFAALATECDLQIGIHEAFKTLDVFCRSLRLST
jgi:hypothetical protein